MRYSGSHCDRCAAVCPKAAICLDGRLNVLEERCAGCLTCTTACPSGALEAEIDFGRMVSGFSAHPFPVLVVSCGKRGASSHCRLPCLGMLSAEHLVVLYAKGQAVVQLDASACECCDSGAMLPHLEGRLRETEERCGLPFSSRVRLVLDAKEIEFRQEALDRRGLFRSFRNLALRGVSRALASPATERKAVSYMEKILPTRRGVLAAGLASLPWADAEKARDAFSFSVTFGESCEGCFGCAKVCPTGALSESDASGSQPSFPRFEPEKCTGCGLCTEFCLSEAVRMDPAV